MKKKNTTAFTIDGSKFMCKKHGLDYRLLCDECVDKHFQISQVIDKIMLLSKLDPK